MCFLQPICNIQFELENINSEDVDLSHFFIIKIIYEAGGAADWAEKKWGVNSKEKES